MFKGEDSDNHSHKYMYTVFPVIPCTMMPIDHVASARKLQRLIGETLIAHLKQYGKRAC